MPPTAEFRGEGWIGMGVFSRNFIVYRVAVFTIPLIQEYYNNEKKTSCNCEIAIMQQHNGSVK